jgi:hypothetical protein
MYDYPNNEGDAIKQLKIKHQGILVNDPTKVINTVPDTTTTSAQGLWSQITSAMEDPFEKRLAEMEKQMELVMLDLKLSRLKILFLEGKFTQEEISNIRKMFMSEDKAAKTLADSIIENA